MSAASDQPGSEQRAVDAVVGIDTGGTFTDCVYFDGARLRVCKLASTPQAPEQAVIAGARALALPPAARLVHGSTVATNAVLESKGAVTAYVTNRGFADLLTIARQARRGLYELEPAPPPVPVPPQLCLEVDQRTGADGSQVIPLTEDALGDLLRRLQALKPEAVAINLLFSFFDEDAERRIEAAIGDDRYVSRSSAVLAEQGEYERGVATWLNASLGPRVGRYLGRLRDALGDFAVMHGAGGTLSAQAAQTHAVQLLLSGPAAGLAGARHVGELAGCGPLLTLDMGGTSTDVAMIEGEISLTSDGNIGGYPVAVPMVDLNTIGAGGGSIAYVDAGGMLKVGPESAGADPGPACYGGGGAQPTVTDANLVLGHLPDSTRLGGDLALDCGAARVAMSALAGQLGLSVKDAAAGVIAVANEAMAGALRVISVQRGVDPREHTLLCFGGAGPLHVCAVAEAMGMTRALVPIHAGVLSALGMLVAARSRELSRSLLAVTENLSDAELERGYAALRAGGEAELAAEGGAAADIQVRASADVRYVG
ncbi:MAG: hydantoinase/oxoprolinase family protein, partial [Salinisphaera sp.]|nr:hydantoinase/oxoprolinase family protein [Salinisphaera sp.]